MSTRPRIALLAALLASTAMAQTSVSYDGTWAASFDGRSGIERDATLVLKDGMGTWKAVAYSRKDACTGLESPVVVTEARDDGLVLEVHRSKVLVGCTDWRVRLKLVDAQTLTGHFSADRTVTLKRR